MSEPLKFPLKLIALDGLGSIIFAIGMALYVGVDILPANLRFDNDGIGYILLGILLMLPFLMHILSWVREQSKRAAMDKTD